MHYRRVFISLLIFIYLFIANVFAINKYVVTVLQPNPIRTPVISWVTVTENSKIQIAWEKQVNDNIVYYNVYRNASENEKTWELAGTVNYNSETYLNDLNSFANIQSYQYKIAAVDKCGNEIFSNTIIRNIYLYYKKNADKNILFWTPYEGIKLDCYRIYKGKTQNNLVLTDSVGADVTTFVDSLWKGSFYYQIEAIGVLADSIAEQTNKVGTEQVFKNKVKSVSNVVSINYDSLLNSFENENLLIYPNPLNTVSVVKFPYDPSLQYQLKILDLLGNVVYQQKGVTGEFLISHEYLTNGLYILQIEGKKMIQKKLIVGGNNL